MTPIRTKRGFRKDLLIAAMMLVGGLALCAAALVQLAPTQHQRMTQATPPLQSTPGADSKPSVPPEPATTGQRPQATPPEPARPDAEAQASGAKPALPPAPAEKVAPPITTK